ncbi:hypothetical protein [Parahaliea mediterranea]|uniref:Rap1a immunity protein domain-containing protein n=1 Tax=Parahaliea mediterranea TaxID=651086 RepID=A0A939IMP4_9GAMM|nr:hypothetical protein [Parahaliea mediterranea]MBN7797222.1 hypothetical protein [Parahaliea mediterranea]
MTRLLLHASVPLCSIALACAAAMGAAPAASDVVADVATNVDSGAALVEACRDAQSGARPGGSDRAGLCEGYLLGYLHANPEVAFSEELPSAYMQRVMRTRAPVHPQTDALKSVAYCLEGANSVREIRAAIAALDPASVAAVSPASVVKRILDKNYRCRS